MKAIAVIDERLAWLAADACEVAHKAALKSLKKAQAAGGIGADVVRKETEVRAGDYFAAASALRDVRADALDTPARVRRAQEDRQAIRAIEVEAIVLRRLLEHDRHIPRRLSDLIAGTHGLGEAAVESLIAGGLAERQDGGIVPTEIASRVGMLLWRGTL